MKTKNIYVSIIGIITLVIISAFCFAQSETREGVNTTTATAVMTTPVTTNEAAKITVTTPVTVPKTTPSPQVTPPVEEIPEIENFLIFNWQEEKICDNLAEVVANIGVSVTETPNSINIEGVCLIDIYSVNIYGEFSSRETPNIIFTLKPGEYETIFDNGYITITVTER